MKIGFLFLAFTLVSSGAEPAKLLPGERLDGSTIRVPDKDGSTYLVPANDPGLLVAVRAKVAGKSVTAVAVVKPQGNAALADLNAQRAKRGLRPYIEDPQLTQAAQAAASYRAARGIFGHCPNDFVYVPPGTRATCSGCAANEQRYGFMACEVFGNHTYCGAAWVLSGNRLYCHAFYR